MPGAQLQAHKQLSRRQRTRSRWGAYLGLFSKTEPELDSREKSAHPSATSPAAIAHIPPNTGARSTASTVLLGAVLSLTLFIVALEQTVVTASLPQISAILSSAEGYSWIGTAYVIGSAATIPVYGKLSDVYGRKPVILTCIAVFIVGSAIAGACSTMHMLIAGRVIQGLGGGGVFGMVNVIMSDEVPLNRRGPYLGLIGTTWTVASCCGPVVGGSLTQTGRWRWCFYLNIPVAGAGWLALFFLLKVHRPARGKHVFVRSLARIDWIGVVASVTATVLLLLGLDWGGSQYAWRSALIIALFCVSGLVFFLFFLYEAHVPREPIMPPALLIRDRTRSISLLGTFCHSLTFMQVFYFLPFLYQSVYGVSPIVASLYVVPLSVIMGVVSILSGVIISWTQRYKELTVVGLALTSVFVGLLSTLSRESSVALRIVYAALFGLATGLNFQTFTIALQTRIDAADIAVATSCVIFVRQLGSSIGIALGGVASLNQQRLLARHSASSEIRAFFSDAHSASGVRTLDRLAPALRREAQVIYMAGFRTSFYVTIAFVSLAALVCVFLPQNKLQMDGQNVGRRRSSLGPVAV